MAAWDPFSPATFPCDPSRLSHVTRPACPKHYVTCPACPMYRVRRRYGCPRLHSTGHGRGAAPLFSVLERPRHARPGHRCLCRGSRGHGALQSRGSTAISKHSGDERKNRDVMTSVQVNSTLTGSRNGSRCMRPESSQMDPGCGYRLAYKHKHPLSSGILSTQTGSYP